MTQTDEGSKFNSSGWFDNPVPIATAALVGGLVGFGLGVWMPTASGDEAPIRVKNGSIELHLLSAGAEWDEDGDRKNWKLKGDPERNGNDYEVIAAPTNSASCTNGLSATGNPVTFTDNEGATIEIRSTGRKTKVKSRDDLTKATNQLITQASTTRFIREIKVGNDVLCTFSAKDTRLRVVLIDP